ncbi:MAG: hypothetical protein NTV72_03650 [Candidatus Taylorbacteria bacterium]|nr:hypothetical protein [Candidatus Taylorbacteria bacterium]
MEKDNEIKNENEVEKSSIGASLGILIIVVILVVGAFYAFNKKVDNTLENNSSSNPHSTSTKKVNVLISTSSPEQDIDNLDLNGLDEQIKKL